MPRHRVAVLAAVLTTVACGGGREHVVPWLPKKPALTRIPPLAAPCDARDLRASLALQGATGSLAGGVALQNVGRRACALVGRPGVRFAGELARATAWRVRRSRAPSVDLEPLRVSAATLRALEPGAEAWVPLFWSEWCPPGTRSGGTIGRPPQAIVLRLPRGRGEIRLRPAHAPRCDVAGVRSTLTVGPFLPLQHEAAPRSRLPLRVTILGNAHSEAKPGVPRLRARRGELLRYEIALTNVSRRTFRFDGCPVYVEQLVLGGPTDAYVLNCRPVRAVAPGERVIFAIAIRVPRNLPRSARSLFFELAPRTYLPPTAAARVVIG